MDKKIYFKIYQDKKNIDGNYYIDTPENFLKYLNDIIKECKDCGDKLFPVVEIIEMTDDEFKNLPDFEGY